MNFIIRLALFLIIGFGMSMPAHSNGPTARLKDIASLQSARDNQLIGYGLVVGLNGTGDSLGNSPFTQRSLISMLERLGVVLRQRVVAHGLKISQRFW